MVHPQTFALSDVVETEASSSARPVGLFEGLLQGHVELLAADVEENSDRYPPEVLELTRALLEKRKNAKSLTEEERNVLDRATLDFATYVPPKTKSEPPARRVVAKKRAKDDEEDAVPIPGFDTPPEAEAPAYWWLR